ncbi:MAG: Gfo/Idh/MocA family oxidoreductase, partial [Sphingomonas sp.]|uniref:Gfo/Idh/MocA family protein n=1 Tax=Sphingomonas sp. TaxID=28214 RepID=UPI00258C6C16
MKRAGAAIAAPSALPVLTGAAAGARRPEPSERITMGLIGCGGMGRGNLSGFLNMPDVDVLAVCDPDVVQRDAAKARVEKTYSAALKKGTYKGCATYNDFRELLARDDIDTVIQATPDHWHALVVIAAAQAGKDCYGEKPLSLTIPQGRAMSD